MRESKAELTDRLRREGRFEAFKKRREELKANGTPAKQAWYQAATEFPAAEHVPLQSAIPAEQLEALRGKYAVPTIEAAFWALEHLDTPWTQPADAPSAGAWSLLQWARQSPMTRTEFFRTFGPKLTASPVPRTLEYRNPKMERCLWEAEAMNSRKS